MSFDLEDNSFWLLSVCRKKGIIGSTGENIEIQGLVFEKLVQLELQVEYSMRNMPMLWIL